MKKKIVTIILTFNSEATIKKVILKAKKISKNVVICDSFSNDGTIKIAKSLHCKIFYKKFTNIPFSGFIENYHKNGQLQEGAKFRKGKRIGLREIYFFNGLLFQPSSGNKN